MATTFTTSRCPGGDTHPPEACPHDRAVRGPDFAPLSSEIPTTPPTPGGEFVIPPGTLPPRPPEPAPTTTDTRARARVLRSGQRAAVWRTLRLAAWWAVCGLTVVAIVLVGNTIIRGRPARAPDPVPAPLVVTDRPAVPSQRRTRARGLVDEGDRWLRRDPPRAEQLFRDALTLDPTNAAASFGVGVTMLQRGADREAVPYLCAAHRTAVGPLRRDVQQLLDQRKLDCP